MKLIQLNVWGGKLVNQIADFLNQEKPDIVCMQEVHDMPGLTNYLFGTLDEIKHLSNFSESFMSPSYSFNYMNRKTDYGNAVLSQLAADHTKTIFTHGDFINDYDCQEVSNNQDPRNFLYVQLENGLHVITYHGFYVPGSKAGSHETLKHMQLILDFIDQLSGPIILTGDFNLTPSSPSIQLLGAKMRDLSVENRLTNTYTQFGRHQKVCDYIFVNDHVKTTKFTMSEALVSDHNALILEFEV